MASATKLKAPLYLLVGDTGASGELLHSARCRRDGEPSIVLQKLPRWYSISVHCFGDVMTDDARNRIFNFLLEASLPGGMVRASNRSITATRLPFGLGVKIAERLAAFVTANREPGPGREHARCEGRKRPDGSIQLKQIGLTRKAA